MCPCSPNSNTLNPVIPPPIPIPGFGNPFSPIQVGLPSFDLPTDLLEDFLDLLNKVNLPFPGLLNLQPHLPGGIKNIFDTIATILNVIAPFLGFYNFIMALLKMIVCVIEVLCAIPNPFAVAAKLKKLFTECLPAFINLFPFIALIAMIIALLLLILALIEYIINAILAIIDAILKNLLVFADAARLQDAQSTLAAANKIASLLCFIQNILSILIALAAILAVIKALSLIGGGPICDDNDPFGCCPPDLCPSFIKNTPDGIPVTNGQLIYYNQIGTDVATIFSDLEIPGIENLFNLPPLREERWQLIDTGTNATFPISSIITPVFSPTNFAFNIFWPDPLTFTADTAPKKAPYTVNMKFRVNPAVFNPADGYGSRFFTVKDCVVVRKPYIGLLNQANFPIFSNTNGTFNIEGGLVYENDGTPYKINGTQATLNTFIHRDISLGSLPISDDAVIFDDVEFIWFPQHAALAGYQIITVGCMPEVNIEKAVQNSIILAEGVAPVINKLGPVPAGQRIPSTGNFLPNVDGALKCVTDALANFRKDVSTGGAAEFRAAVQSCLGDLRDQTVATVCGAIIAGVSQFKSTIAIDTDVQFTTRNIKASVVLKDGSGTVISNNIPVSCASDIASRLKGEVTLGTISSFVYDGYTNFDALITSQEVGDGQLTVSFDNKVFSTVVSGVGNNSSSIVENILNYTFVDAAIDSPVRRDSSDTSGA